MNRFLAPHGLQYAPDPTTSNRACVGGGIGNNTCGAHSVIYGKTLDHIQEVDVVLSDASRAQFRTLEPHELEARLQGDSLESDIYRGVLRIAQDNLPEIEARYPEDHAAGQRLQPGLIPGRRPGQFDQDGGRLRRYVCASLPKPGSTWCPGPP